jgi:FkbM family methyltransferase
MPLLAPFAKPWNDDRRVEHALGRWSMSWFRWLRWREKHWGLPKEFQLYSRHANFPLWCRGGTSDLEVFRQIFLDREYSCLDEAEGVDLVIDCGANVGYSSAYFLSRFPGCRVIAVEPDAGNFAACQRNLAPYGDRVRLVRSGIWSHSTGLKISEIPYRDGREWAVQVRPTQADETPDLQAVDIGTLLAESGSRRISILKIDIEAAERFVFAENYRHWLEAADNLVIELHDEQCSDIFFRAIRGLPLRVWQCGELTVCRRERLPLSRAA